MGLWRVQNERKNIEQHDIVNGGRPCSNEIIISVSTVVSMAGILKLIT
jgi:uncharacterized protein (DUF433 family)